ncbi:hypothetical protein MLD38_005222 [Melastoma candidum]|uniref:Uncharacterized protein n=1 Tax=Melastoma candidum TaxID=119954 RepID=A0ACB9S8K2_9MYRT|nr:hypothetical protein MLD38_005222 [Melastoma candidum]
MRKLVLLVCKLLLNFGGNPIVPFHLHDFKLMSRKLAPELGSILLQFLSKSSRKAKANILAGEMQKIGDTLVLVSIHYDCSGLVCPNSIFLDTRVNKTKDDMVQVLFPNFPVHKPTEDVAEVREHPVVAKGVVVHEEEYVEEKCEEEEVDAPPATSEKGVLAEQGVVVHQEEYAEEKFEQEKIDVPPALSEKGGKKGKQKKHKGGGSSKKGGRRR